MLGLGGLRINSRALAAIVAVGTVVGGVGLYSLSSHPAKKAHQPAAPTGATPDTGSSDITSPDNSSQGTSAPFASVGAATGGKGSKAGRNSATGGKAGKGQKPGKGRAPKTAASGGQRVSLASFSTPSISHSQVRAVLHPFERVDLAVAALDGPPSVSNSRKLRNACSNLGAELSQAAIWPTVAAPTQQTLNQLVAVGLNIAANCLAAEPPASAAITQINADLLVANSDLQMLATESGLPATSGALSS